MSIFGRIASAISAGFRGVREFITPPATTKPRVQPTFAKSPPTSRAQPPVPPPRTSGFQRFHDWVSPPPKARIQPVFTSSAKPVGRTARRAPEPTAPASTTAPPGPPPPLTTADKAIIRTHAAQVATLTGGTSSTIYPKMLTYANRVGIDHFVQQIAKVSAEHKRWAADVAGGRYTANAAVLDRMAEEDGYPDTTWYFYH